MTTTAPRRKVFPSPVPLSPSPVWRTPDHPPYSEMIQAAIRTLAEEGGSTLEAIDAYIKSNYHDLPWGHRNLYPHYFKKLLVVGEVKHVGGGRFIIASSLPSVPQSARRSNAEKGWKGSSKGKEIVPFVPAEAKVVKMGVDDWTIDLPQMGEMTERCEEEAPLAMEENEPPQLLLTQYSPQTAIEEPPMFIQCDSAVAASECEQTALEVQCDRAMITTLDFDLQTSTATKSDVDIPFEKQCHSLVSGQGLAEINGELSLPKKRGRGRPRKIEEGINYGKVPTTPEGKTIPDGNLMRMALSSNGGAGGPPMPMGCGRSPGSGRRQGRPPKRKMEAEDVIIGIDAVVSHQPPEEKAETEDITFVIDAAVSPQEISRGSLSYKGRGRGRGRPPKKKVDAEDVNVAVAPPESSRGSTLSKKRERLPKEKTKAKDVDAAASPQESNRCSSSSRGSGRRRGRPPKQKTDAAESNATFDVNVVASPPENNQCSSLSEGHGRGRGRPPKKKADGAEANATFDVNAVVSPQEINHCSPSSKVHGRGRGRPPKKKTDAAEANASFDINDTFDVNAVVSPQENNQCSPSSKGHHGRGRERPPKKKDWR